MERSFIGGIRMKKTRILCAAVFACLTVALFVFCLPVEVAAETHDIYTYTVENGQATLTKCDASASGHIAIPATLGGYPVTTIGKNAFDSCSKLVRVTFYKGITTIEEGAFSNCPELTEVTIPEGLTTIGANAFANCVKLEKLHIPDTIAYIDSTAFENCNSLSYNEYDNGKYLGNDEKRYVVFMDTLTNNITNCEIHEDTKILFAKAFYECVGLTNVVIPNGVKTIGERAFFRCTNLRELTIGKGVTSIGEKAFSLCQGLTAVTVPDSVVAVGKEAFSNCKKMTDIVLPKSLTAIGEEVFHGCTALQNIYYKGAEEQWALIAGSETIQNTMISYNASGCIHQWDAGTVTKEANCVEPGEKTYTCPTCQEKRIEELPVLTTHTYQNDCDPECDFCHAVRETTHKYSTSWSADENGHWYECTACKEKKEAAVPHTPGPAATDKDPQICTDCGYVLAPAIGAPEPTEPAPTEPQPTEPAPTEPEATEPTPTDPEPSVPDPTEPQPEKDGGRSILVIIIVAVTIAIAVALGVLEVCFLRKRRK
ncbi:MAG: hypothetical protein E7461_05710 [Ruminococcaceae bacterium]|nr:hypothetical protein [Oscillospiraceae bacterium]